MRKPGIARHLRHMRRNWDRRAKENARYYVATGQEEWSDQEFYQAGEPELRDHIFNDLGNIIQGQETARYYVATGQEEWSDQEFYQAGEQELRDHIFNDLGNICQGKDPKSMKVLEIGCGAGRVTAPLAQFFGEIHAVDISRHMVRHARQAVAAFPNAYIYHNRSEEHTSELQSLR